MSSTLVDIEGMLHDKASVKYTSSGKPLATFEMAVANGYGKNAKEPFLFKVTAWNALAEQIAGFAPETKFTVYGRLTSRTYEWQGQQKKSMDIVANVIDVRETDSKPAARPQTQQVSEEECPF